MRRILFCAGLLLFLNERASAQKNVLLNPSAPVFKTRAPDSVNADIETSRGTISVQLIRAWAPNAVDRFYNLARSGYYDDTRFYRVLWGFIAQFGTSSSVAVSNAWGPKFLPVDKVKEKNVRGTLAFAQNKPTDRATTVFINLSDNKSLDSMKFVPFARVTSGMEVADSIYALYGEKPVAEYLNGPKKLFTEGNKYLDREYPKLDKIIRITVKP